MTFVGLVPSIRSLSDGRMELKPGTHARELYRADLEAKLPADAKESPKIAKSIVRECKLQVQTNYVG